MDEAKAKYETLSSAEELRALMERFLGPSLSSPGGKLLAPKPETMLGIRDIASAHSNVAAPGIEPGTRGL